MSSQALLAFIEALDTGVDTMNSIIVVRHGQVIAEGWWTPFAADTPHQMFSLTKSFTSTAVGLAQAEGKLSIDDPVLKYFPDVTPAAGNDFQKGMRIRDLLAMSTGPPHRAVVPGQHHVDEDVLRAPRAAQAGHDLPLQHAGQLHPLGHRAEGHRPEGSRLPAVAAVHAARHRHAALGDQPRGRHASAATACGCAPRTSRASASSICRRASGRASSSSRPTGSPRRRRGRRRTAAARRPTGIRATATSSGARATSRSAATARTASSAWCCRSRTPSSR